MPYWTPRANRSRESHAQTWSTYHHSLQRRFQVGRRPAESACWRAGQEHRRGALHSSVYVVSLAQGSTRGQIVTKGVSVDPAVKAELKELRRITVKELELLCKQSIWAHAFAMLPDSRSSANSSASTFVTARIAERTQARLTGPTFFHPPPSLSGCPGRSMFVPSICRKHGIRGVSARSAARHYPAHQQRCLSFPQGVWTRSLPSRPMPISLRQVGPPGITTWTVHRVLMDSRRRRCLAARPTGRLPATRGSRRFSRALCVGPCSPARKACVLSGASGARPFFRSLERFQDVPAEWAVVRHLFNGARCHDGSDGPRCSSRLSQALR